MERIKANFEKKRKQVNMLSVQRTEYGGIPYANSTLNPHELKADVFSPSNTAQVEYYGRKDKDNSFKGN